MSKLLSLAVIAIIATGLLSVSVIGLLQQVNAKASENANPVAPRANTNQGYMESCKQFRSAKDCATGPGNNGDFTSSQAHFYNKPN